MCVHVVRICIFFGRVYVYVSYGDVIYAGVVLMHEFMRMHVHADIPASSSCRRRPSETSSKLVIGAPSS